MYMAVSLHGCASHECPGPTEARRGNGSPELELCSLFGYLSLVQLEPDFCGRGVVIFTAEPFSRHLTLFLCPGEDLLAKVYLE